MPGILYATSTQTTRPQSLTLVTDRPHLARDLQAHVVRQNATVTPSPQAQPKSSFARIVQDARRQRI